MGILIEMLMCEDMTSCTDLTYCHVVHWIASRSKYFLQVVSATSSKAIYRVASVRTFNYSQPFWLK